MTTTIPQLNCPPVATTGPADDAECLMRTVLRRHFANGRHLKLGIDGRFWLYDQRVWRPVPDDWISGRALEVIAAGFKSRQATATLVRQCMGLLKARLAEKDDCLGFVAEPPVIVNCLNGELWIDPTGEVDLRKHRPESHLRHCLKIEYDPDAKCPEYDRALLEIFDPAADPKAMRRHWNELMGYIIQPRRNIPSIVVLLGGGANGKTVLIKTAIRLLGDMLVHAQRVEDLERNRFAMGSLFGKLLFVDDDVSAGARLPDGMLKTISEAKTITGELKFKPAFNFTVRAVPVLLCNNVPSLADLSHGMTRRLMVIPFDRTFTEADADPDLFDFIWENEMPGVLNRALAGVKRVIARGSKFRPPHEVRRASKRWLQQANPLPGFIAARCNGGHNNRCMMRGFFSEFISWARGSGFQVTQTQLNVRRSLEHLGYVIRHTNKGDAIIGLKLKR